MLNEVCDRIIVKDNNEEKTFINNLIKIIRFIDTSDLSDVELLKNVALTLACSIERIWEENSKCYKLYSAYISTTSRPIFTN